MESFYILIFKISIKYVPAMPQRACFPKYVIQLLPSSHAPHRPISNSAPAVMLSAPPSPVSSTATSCHDTPHPVPAGHQMACCSTPPRPASSTAPAVMPTPPQGFQSQASLTTPPSTKLASVECSEVVLALPDLNGTSLRLYGALKQT